MSSTQALARRRDVFHTLDKVLSAMKALAYSDLQKLQSQREPQAFQMDRVRRAWLQLRESDQDSISQGRPALIVLGTERGFCGDINRLLLDELTANPPGKETRVITVGERFSSQAGPHSDWHQLAGASNTEDIEPLTDQILAVLSPSMCLRDWQLSEVIYLDDTVHRLIREPLLPAASQSCNLNTSDWLHYDSIAHLTEKLLPLCLFTTLRYCLTMAGISENRRRLGHLEGALHHLEDSLQALSVRANQLRQANIIESIEALLFSQMEGD